MLAISNKPVVVLILPERAVAPQEAIALVGREGLP